MFCVKNAIQRKGSVSQARQLFKLSKEQFTSYDSHPSVRNKPVKVYVLRCPLMIRAAVFPGCCLQFNKYSKMSIARNKIPSVKRPKAGFLLAN